MKMKKQMAYANANAIPFVAMAGEDEINKGIFALKDMNTGEQLQLTAEEMLTHLLKTY